jgi:hypothetical protein
MNLFIYLCFFFSFSFFHVVDIVRILEAPYQRLSVRIVDIYTFLFWLSLFFFFFYFINKSFLANCNVTLLRMFT